MKSHCSPPWSAGIAKGPLVILAVSVVVTAVYEDRSGVAPSGSAQTKQQSTTRASATPAGIPYPTYTAYPTYTSCPTYTPPLISAPPATPAQAPQGATTPERQQAQVIEIVDGDTIKVQIGGEVYTVRYIGIDTPEIKHPEKPVEWMGAEASAANEQLVGGQVVELERDVSETDRTAGCCDTCGSVR